MNIPLGLLGRRAAYKDRGFTDPVVDDILREHGMLILEDFVPTKPRELRRRPHQKPPWEVKTNVDWEVGKFKVFARVMLLCENNVNEGLFAWLTVCSVH